MSVARYLVDTSAVVRILHDPGMRIRWEEQVTAGFMGICPIIELELLFSARSKADRERLVELMATAFVWVPMPDQVFQRASEVQALLTDRGWHRSASAVDLLLAATAELQRLTLLHYDHDFDQVVKVTRQPATWLAEPGSID